MEKKRYRKNEISRHYVALTDFTPCQAQPKKKKAQRSLVGVADISAINHHTLSTIFKFIKSSNVPIRICGGIYGLLRSQQHCLSVFCSVCQSRYIITTFNRCIDHISFVRSTMVY